MNFITLEDQWWRGRVRTWQSADVAGWGRGRVGLRQSEAAAE